MVKFDLNIYFLLFVLFNIFVVSETSETVFNIIYKKFWLGDFYCVFDILGYYCRIINSGCYVSLP